MAKTYKLEICRKVKGSRVLFYVTINGYRASKTNYARKYDATKLMNHIKSMDESKVINWLNKQIAA